MRQARRHACRLAVLVLLLAAAAAGVAQDDDAESDAYAWLQYGADGRPHVRVIPSDRAACPQASADDRGVPLMLRAQATAGFDRVLCDAALPDDARTVRIGTRALPPLPARISRLVVLGDTGCRITARQIQDCKDRRAWPFARIAESIAGERPRPDLIVHVGNYVSRDTACPAGDSRCAGSPVGDTWSSWAVDFFEPGSPLFAVAPIVWVRGSREACRHNGLGWTRYLGPDPGGACRVHESPIVVAFDDLRIIDIDSAAGGDRSPAAAVFAGDEPLVVDAAAGRETFVVTHRPPLRTSTALEAERAGAQPAAIVAGHLAPFAILPSAQGSPVIVVGTGGYAVLDRVAGGWSISRRGPDGSELRRCELRDRAVHC